MRADKVEIVLDRFGYGTETFKVDDDTARAFVKVCKSEQFFGWIVGMGNAVKLPIEKTWLSRLTDSKKPTRHLGYLLKT